MKTETDQGYTSIEAALVVPTVLVLMLFLVQGLFAVLQSRNVQFAAEQAADAAARYEATDSDGDLVAGEVMAELGIEDATVTVDRSADEVVVTIEAETLELVPGGFTVKTTASAPIEEFLELGERS